MFDTGKVILGIAIFLVLVTSPLWFNAATSAGPSVPELEAPPGGEEACVEKTEWMRAYHMDLLDDWRDRVVREGERVYVSDLSGKDYEMSLSNTCMDCHTNKAEFCDRCHDYMAVTPYCWDCHVEPKEAQ